VRSRLLFFRLLLCAGWIVLLWITLDAIWRMGASAAALVFLGDFAHPWRAQFNTDFSLTLLLVAAWMIYRSRSWITGIICALLAIILGSLFTIPYLLAVSFQTGGDIRTLLLGSRTLARDRV
jgi:uncharacterized protein DUF1475